MSISRRQLLFGIGVPATVALGYGRFVEPSWLDQTEKQVKLRGRSLRRPLRILHLSDLHVSRYVTSAFLQSAFELGAATKPDLICLTGDYITVGQSFDAPSYEKALRWLSSVAPTYAVFGNHDGGVFGGLPTNNFVGSLLTRAGISILHNRSQFLDLGGTLLRLAGVGDHWTNEVDAEGAFSLAGASDLTVVMNHNPDAKMFFGQFPWDLMLCGHTHGGQVRIPLIGAPYVSVKDRKYVQGLLDYDKGQIHITRGVGTLERIRFNCRPEVSLLVVR